MALLARFVPTKGMVVVRQVLTAPPPVTTTCASSVCLTLYYLPSSDGDRTGVVVLRVFTFFVLPCCPPDAFCDILTITNLHVVRTVAHLLLLVRAQNIYLRA